MTIKEAIEQLKNLRKCEKYLYPSDIKAIDIALEHMDLNDTYISMNMHNKLYKKQKSINYELVDDNQELINENNELKRLLLLALDDFAVNYINYCDHLECSDCPYHVDIEQFEGCSTRWKHLDEAVQILGDDADCWR